VRELDASSGDVDALGPLPEPGLDLVLLVPLHRPDEPGFLLLAAQVLL
jgi:hypothetical protein